MKARIKFSKTGSMRFIGHLDVMRYFQKAFRRAEIPISYSQGFSPHQLMSFASPLGIGLSSDAEYLDLTLDSCDAPELMIKRINAQMNEEIRVKEFTILKEDAKPSMAMLAACDYMIAVKEGGSSFLESEHVMVQTSFSGREELLRAFMAQEQIEIVKKTKRSEKLVDIRDNIYVLSDQQEAFQLQTGQQVTELCLDSDLYTPLLFVQLTAGSVVNIKPELVLEALAAFAGVPYEPLVYQIHRLEMYGDVDGKKGEVHTKTSEVPCRLVPLSVYDQMEWEGGMDD